MSIIGSIGGQFRGFEISAMHQTDINNKGAKYESWYRNNHISRQRHSSS
jgi:hypothetical protein